ncbi:MAG: MFS transporter, partial [Dehalococcoidia bacterium]|nr:MFS transporter [Dehalococcoidia bacterium]
SGRSNGRPERFNLAAQVYGDSGDAGSNGHVAVGPPPAAPAVQTAPPSAPAAAPPSPTTGAPASQAVAEGPREPPQGRFRTFDSLRDRGFRWYLLSSLGQMASLNMQMLVRGFLVFELTGSYAALGTLFLVNSVPGLVLSMAGGVIADRVRSKKRVVQVGQVLNGANALVLALLIYTDVLRFEHILVAAVVHGAVMSMMMPARQAMLPEVVGLERLTNAVALNAASMNAMRLMAPSLAGFLIAAFGPAWVYFLITGLYVCATALLAPVPSESRIERGPDGPAAAGAGTRSGGGVGEMVAGVRYIATDPEMRLLLGTAILFAVFSMPYLFLLPGFVASVLEKGPGELGLLMTLTGIGSLAGSIVVASLPAKRRGRVFLLSGVALGISLIAFSASTWFWVTAAIMVVVGVGDAGRQSLSMVLVQAYVQDAYRGRVMAVYMMQRSFATFGTFFVGIAASFVGAQAAIGAIAVVLLVLSGALLLFAPRLRNLD